MIYLISVLERFINICKQNKIENRKTRQLKSAFFSTDVLYNIKFKMSAICFFLITKINLNNLYVCINKFNATLKNTYFCYKKNYHFNKL